MTHTRHQRNPTGDEITRRQAEMVLKTAKEIVVKFIETGKVTPSSFDSVFHEVFAAVNKEVSSLFEVREGTGE